MTETRAKGRRGGVCTKYKKLIAPIIITIIFIVYLCSWFYFFIFLNGFKPGIFEVIGCIVPIALIGVSVGNLIQRIKEIRSGEEDDLGKY